jgi:hypothetical protein
MSDRITELDVLDPEREAMSRWFACSECGEPQQAIDGHRDDTCLRCIHWLQGLDETGTMLRDWSFDPFDGFPYPPV